MCSTRESLWLSALLWWPRFYTQLGIELAATQWKKSTSLPQWRLRTPLLTLHISTLKPMQEPRNSKPKQTLLLVGSNGR